MTPNYLNHLGIVNALGSGAAEICANFLANQQSKLTYVDNLFSGHITWAGEVKAKLLTIPSRLSNYDCRNNQLLITAYEQISTFVEQLKQKFGPHRIGVVLGTSTSGIASGEQAIKYYQQHHVFPKSFHYIQQEVGSCSEFLADYTGVTGIRFTVSTACSSSGKAIAAADRLIKAGLCDAVIVGGSDSLCELTLNGFDSLDLLSPEICNPFSLNRKGLNIGEGAALFVLSKEVSAIKLSGAGESSDGYHISAPDPSGRGAKMAINQAISQAKKKPEDISYINLHGTATRKNDEMESAVISELFPHKPPCNSSKPLIGHTLGAAAAQELGLCWLLLSEHNIEKQLPIHLWDGQQDLQLASINLIKTPCEWAKPIFMSNSFAFGGSNVSLIIEKE